jgi:Tectonin domain
MNVWQGRSALFLLVFAAALLQGCGGRSGVVTTAPKPLMPTAKSVSPASVSAPPMARTAILPSSAMSLRTPRSAIVPVGFTQLPGGAIFVVASPDGSIWALSSQGSGADRSIWHYANGNWTNITGAAMRLAVAPNGTLWAVNSAGGIYSYSNGTWTQLAGGASDIAIGADGSVYVVSNQGAGPDRGIWHYTGGGWTQIPGAAVQIAASWDTVTYPGITPGGFYVTNSASGIYYYNPSSGFVQIPGGAAQVVPTNNGGVFALGYVTNGDGSRPVYYNNLENGLWNQQAGAGTSVAANSAHVYVTGAAGGIYTAAVSAPNRVTLSVTTQIDPGNVHYLVVTFTNNTANGTFVDYIGSGTCANEVGFCNPNQYGWTGEMTLNAAPDHSTVYVGGNPDYNNYPTVSRICYNAWFPASESFHTFATAQVVCVPTGH